MKYPDEILRGIPNSAFIDKDEYPTSNLFYFDKQSKRSDNFKEESICWKDDEEAVFLLLNQKKDDKSLQFKAGIAVVSRDELDRLINKPTVKQQLSYERNIIPGNKYHGNLLLNDNVEKSVMKRIAAGIALCVTQVISPSSTTTEERK